MKGRAIVIDLDGTILDISERDAFARYEALNHLGYEVSLAQIKQHYRYGVGLMGILKFLNISLTEEETEEYLNARLSSFTDRNNALTLTKIHKGATEALATLSQKCRLILVTSRRKLSSVEEELDWFNIRGFFSLIVTRDVASMHHGVENIPLLPFHEQRAKLYECVIGVTKLDPKALICVGDSVGELEPAKKMQMTTIGVLTGISSRKDLEEFSDLIVHDITKVSEALSRLDCSYTR